MVVMEWELWRGAGLVALVAERTCFFAVCDDEGSDLSMESS